MKTVKLVESWRNNDGRQAKYATADGATFVVATWKPLSSSATVCAVLDESGHPVTTGEATHAAALTAAGYTLD